MRVIFLLFFVIKIIVFQNLQSHGFGFQTRVFQESTNGLDCNQNYNLICFKSLIDARESIFDSMPKIITYDVDRKHKQLSNITVIGRGVVPCLIRLFLYEHIVNNGTIVYRLCDWFDCSPIQQIYVKGKGFIDACLIQPDDELENFYNKKIIVGKVCLIQGDFNVCAFTLEKNHTFYVGYSGILTHNFALNLGIGFAFDQGLGASGISLLSGINTSISFGIGLGAIAIKYGYDYCTKTATYAMEATQQTFDIFEKAFTSDIDFLNTPVSQILEKKNNNNNNNNRNNNRNNNGNNNGDGNGGPPQNNNNSNKNNNNNDKYPWLSWFSDELEKRLKEKNKHVTNQEVRKVADCHNLKEIKGTDDFNSHGQLVFKGEGGKMYTRDVDSHKGGFFKVFNGNGKKIDEVDVFLQSIFKK